MRTVKFLVALVPMAALASGCSWSNKAKGAVIGAGAGGAAGAVVGHATGSTVRGAIIGAAVGGAAGAVIGHQMDQQAHELAYDMPGAVVQRVGEGITVTFPNGVLFGDNSDQLLPDAQENMRKYAESLNKYPDTHALIVGHTDSRGSNVYNKDLSERRAAQAASFVALQGVDRGRLTTAGKGEDEPVATNDNVEGQAQNRRVEIAIYHNTPPSGTPTGGQ